MALYTAKNQGRNRAIGIAAAQATDEAALVRMEEDFDQAWTDGRVSLLQQAGPGGMDGAAAAGGPPPGERANQDNVGQPTAA
jgi:hypothetical protein